MHRALMFGILLALLALPSWADGPETGLLGGTVTNSEGEGLPGVQISLEGGRGAQVTVTNESGQYRFNLLLPGSYVVTASLEGFSEAKKEALIAAGGKHQVDLEMRLETAETITVTSEAPMVDKFNVTAGATLTAEVGGQAAGVNRTYYGVVNLLPGVSADPENAAIQGMRPSVNGGHFADSGVFVDGVDTTFARFGGSRLILPTTATTEVTMEAGGSSAEYGRFVSSSTNVIVQSGTNRFHGAAGGSYQDVGWASDYESHHQLTTTREFFPVSPDFFKRTKAEEDNNATGYEASFGGPIKRDKAWFFLALAEIDTNDLDKVINGDTVDNSWVSESRIGKINFQPGAKHQIAGSYIDAPQYRRYTHSPSGDKWTPTPHDLPSELATLNWNYSVSSDVFFETKLAVMSSDENKFLAPEKQNIDRFSPIEDVVAPSLAIKQQDPRYPPNPAGGPHWPGNNYSVYVADYQDDTWYNGWLLDNGFGTNEYPRDQANAALTWFAAENHELKFGVDYQSVKWDSNVRKTNVYSGPVFSATSTSGYADCGVARGFICFYADYNPADLRAQGNFSRSLNQNTAAFARDRFTVGDHWTFNLGIRVEQQNNKNDKNREVVDATMFAPRLSTTYDLKGNGRQLLSLNVGRTHAQLNQQLTNQWLMEGWTGYYGQDNYLWCDALDVALSGVVPALATCSAGEGYNFFLRRSRPGGMFRMIDAGVFDWDLEPYYKDEAILGFEWQFTSNWALDAKAIYWELGDMIGATIQQAPDGSLFELTANYKDYPDILRAIGVVPEANFQYWEDGVKNYEALQVQVNRRFAKGWALYTNVTWADTETTGSGAWWNNWNSTYGYMYHLSLTQRHIDICSNAQIGRNSAGNPIPIDANGTPSAGRKIPIDCQATLGPHLGEPVSIINRKGKDGVASERYDEGGTGADRPVIAKTFGFKQWTMGSNSKQTFSLGGSATWQMGQSWGRVEEIPTGDVAITAGSTEPAGLLVGTNGLDMKAEPNGTRRLRDHYWLNLTGAYGFPLGERVTGELRVEVMNATDAQARLGILDKGEVRPVRREFQQPRQFRVLGTLHF
jgi:Carboxypeptidase regulatory-like domain/TonB dependent receptor